MTSDFSSVNFLGEGGFGPVHKGFVGDKCRPGLAPQPVAVKLLDPDGDQGHREWLVRIPSIPHSLIIGIVLYNMLPLILGHLTTKNDVYSFGVVLLELLTGRRTTDKKRPPREQNLVDWAKPYLKDHHKLESIIDQRLEGQYSSEGARKVAALAHQCLSHSPKTRPTMSHVVKILELIAQLTDAPFVYIAPAQGRADAEIKEDEEEDEDEGKAKKETGRKQRRKRGYRHKHPIPIRVHGVYTDTHLYRAFKNNEMIGVRIEGR
ncbi:hypothetical protein SASPL_141799 [Salvia splendens]|uniref:Protein kinase domain-containing protein n=1 Tax=Salvia splendens TaxID=180675 RepID=A0A8X8WJD4_SALSN|nr:hypothetical protein SASPL_141799 [Salvia splendens]